MRSFIGLFNACQEKGGTENKSEQQVDARCSQNAVYDKGAHALIFYEQNTVESAVAIGFAVWIVYIFHPHGIVQEEFILVPACG